MTFKHTLNYLLHFFPVTFWALKNELRFPLQGDRFCMNKPFHFSMQSIHFKDIPI